MMIREFIRTKTFENSWKNIGLVDEDLYELEQILLNNSHIGDVIPHLSGARKLRFAINGRGKSGSIRVVYVDIMIREQIYLLLAYPKNVQASISSEQKKVLNNIISVLKED